MLPPEKVLRINCPGYGKDGKFNVDRARVLGEYWAVVVDPVSVWHIFDGGSSANPVLIFAAIRRREAGIKDDSFDAGLCKKDFGSRQEEFQNFFAKGGVLVCFLEPPLFLTSLYEEKNVRRRCTLFNYEWLFGSEGQRFPLELTYYKYGTEVNATDAGKESNFADYLALKHLEWRTCAIQFKDAATKPTILAKNVDEEVVAFSIKIDEGKAVFLPPYTAEKALGDALKNYLDEVLMRCIEAEVEALRLRETPAASWTKKYTIRGMRELQENIEALEGQIEGLQEEKKGQEDRLRNLERIRDTLLNRDGRILKETVIKVLKRFGLNAIPGPEGRDDIVIKKDENTATVLEVKGTKSSAAEGDAAQLSKWVDRVFKEEKQVPKGILLVNGFRDKNPLEGRERVFPKQMLEYCEDRKYCLLTTVQLFNIYCAFKRGEIKGDEILKELMSCDGIYEGHTNLEENMA